MGTNRRPSHSEPEPYGLYTDLKQPSEADIETLAGHLQAVREAHASIYDLSVAQSTLREALQTLHKEGSVLGAEDRAYATVALRGGIDYATSLLTEAYGQLHVAKAGVEHVKNHDHEKPGDGILMRAVLAKLRPEDVKREEHHRYHPVRALSLVDTCEGLSIRDYLRKSHEDMHQEFGSAATYPSERDRYLTALSTFFDNLSGSDTSSYAVQTDNSGRSSGLHPSEETLLAEAETHFKPETVWNLTDPLPPVPPQDAESVSLSEV